MPIIKAVVFFPLEITTLLHSAVRVRMHVEGVISFSCTLTLIATDGISLLYITYRYVLICLMFIPPPELWQKYRQVSDWVDAEQMM